MKTDCAHSPIYDLQTGGSKCRTCGILLNDFNQEYSEVKESSNDSGGDSPLNTAHPPTSDKPHDYGSPEFISETYAMGKFNSHQNPNEWLASYRGYLDCYKQLSSTNEHLQKENDELNRRVIELQSADMTHEYNNAEAERVWPQIKQQIIDEATEELQKENSHLRQRLEEEYNRGYGDGYKDATNEARQEIRDHYRPNNE